MYRFLNSSKFPFIIKSLFSFVLKDAQKLLNSSNLSFTKIKNFNYSLRLLFQILSFYLKCFSLKTFWEGKRKRPSLVTIKSLCDKAFFACEIGISCCMKIKNFPQYIKIWLIIFI